LQFSFYDLLKVIQGQNQDLGHR